MICASGTETEMTLERLGFPPSYSRRRTNGCFCAAAGATAKADLVFRRIPSQISPRPIILK